MVHRFEFDPRVSFSDAEASLLLARWGTESLHGSTRARLEARCRTDDDRRTIEIDASSVAGRTLSRLFLGFVEQEFSASQYRVDVLDGPFASKSVISPSDACAEDPCQHAKM